MSLTGDILKNNRPVAPTRLETRRSAARSHDRRRQRACQDAFGDDLKAPPGRKSISQTVSGSPAASHQQVTCLARPGFEDFRTASGENAHQLIVWARRSISESVLARAWIEPAYYFSCFLMVARWAVEIG